MFQITEQILMLDKNSKNNMQFLRATGLYSRTMIQSTPASPPLNDSHSEALGSDYLKSRLNSDGDALACSYVAELKQRSNMLSVIVFHSVLFPVVTVNPCDV